MLLFEKGVTEVQQNTGFQKKCIANIQVLITFFSELETSSFLPFIFVFFIIRIINMLMDYMVCVKIIS